MESYKGKGIDFDNSGVAKMPWANITAIGQWIHNVEPILLLVVTAVSLVIVLGCAAASWLCPSEKKDCIFHRHVM